MRYYECMSSSDAAFFHSLSGYPDGQQSVSFERLPLEPPRMERALGRDFMVLPGASLEALAYRAFSDMAFRLRPSYIGQLAAMAVDTHADERERLVIQTLLINASIASEGVFPLCQDTGTASVYGWKGDRILTGCLQAETQVGQTEDADYLARGAALAWRDKGLRNSQILPLEGFNERNSGDNTPFYSHILSVKADKYRFLFVAKGGGSANKTALFQETKRLLDPEAFAAFVEYAVAPIGVSACPPYRIVVILGGQSPEEATRAAHLASAGALDALASSTRDGGPYRDKALEAVLMGVAGRSGWGAQFGGRLLARDARVIRLPRHAASLPVVVAVSCAAHRQAYAYVSRQGYFIEHLAGPEEASRIVAATQNKPIASILKNKSGDSGLASTARRVDIDGPGTAAFKATISGLRAGELVQVWGKVVLARDAVHARLLSMIEAGETLPEWSRYPVFYASPSKTPHEKPVGSIGPTTSRRMDGYLEVFGSRGIFPLSIGKGERGAECTRACKAYGGAYIAAVGGAAALNASLYVASSIIIDWPELGMEAVRLVELRGLPALVAVDSEGGDYYAQLRLA